MSTSNLPYNLNLPSLPGQPSVHQLYPNPPYYYLPYANPTLNYSPSLSKPFFPYSQFNNISNPQTQLLLNNQSLLLNNLQLPMSLNSQLLAFHNDFKAQLEEWKSRQALKPDLIFDNIESFKGLGSRTESFVSTLDVKKEADEEEECDEMSESLGSTPSKVDAPAKKASVCRKYKNRTKNLPGLIIQRVRTSVKKCLARYSKLESLEQKMLSYIEEEVKCLNQSEKEQLRYFLLSYQKNWRTWSTIKIYIQGGAKFGKIFLQVILGFLGAKGKFDFEDWVENGRMREKSTSTVVETKNMLYRKFLKISKQVNSEDVVKKKLRTAKKEDN